MNPVLILLILLGAIACWFLLAGLFRTIGGAANSFADDVKKAVFDDDLSNDNKENVKNE